MKIKFEAAIKELEQTLAKEKSVANAKLAEANLGFQNKFEQFHKEAETKLMTYQKAMEAKVTDAEKKEKEAQQLLADRVEHDRQIKEADDKMKLLQKEKDDAIKKKQEIYLQ